jgi:thioesterase domain-containing protein
MTPAELEQYLHSHIPITAAMAIGVERVAANEVVLRAPLKPNINHRETLFGGSGSAIAIVAAWSLLHLRLAATGIAHRLVIQRNTMSYDAPVEGDFTARAFLAPDTDWERAIDTLTRRGKARITASAELIYDGAVAGRMDADFVALAVKQ